MSSSSSFGIDDILQKWFPIIGVIFIVSGLSYLFYDGFWSQLNETGRLTIGFLVGVAAISGGFTFQDRLKYFADAIIGGGILTLYVSLIYGSRFDSTQASAIIPEMWTLVIATIFAIGVAYFSSKRASKVILSLGILGGYATPFFMGQAGTFDYSLDISAYFAYFIAINIITLWVVQKFFLPAIGLLNIIGLFAGTTALSFISGKGFDENITFSSLFLILSLGLHISIAAVNSKKHQNENDPFLFAGYILPLLWYGGVIRHDLMPVLNTYQYALYFIVSAAIYLGAWYFVKVETQSEKHYGLYFGGIASIVLALLALSETLQSYSGLVFSGGAIVFALLYLKNPLLQRQIAFLCFGATGVIMTLQNITEPHFIGGNFLFYDMKSFFMCLTFLPFLASYAFSKKEEDSEIDTLQYGARIIALISIGIITLSNIIQHAEIPKDFLIFTIPALVLAILGCIKSEDENKSLLLEWAFWLGGIGFLRTFFIMIQRIYPTPDHLYALQTEESLIGITTLAVFGILLYSIRKNASSSAILESENSFAITFVFYLTLFITVTHELLLGLNYFGIAGSPLDGGGIKALVVSLWWASLASFMILSGVKKSSLLSEKNIGFALLLFTILKIVIYDLAHIDKNLKVILFILVGGLILGISYFSHRKKEEGETSPQEALES